MTPRYLAMLFGCVALAASAAQSLPESPPRLATEVESVVERLDTSLRDRVLVRDDARARFIAAQFSRADPDLSVRDLAAAFAREPREPLHLASLAFACMERTLPVRPECAATDYLAQWSFRDGDNALPWLLLAERARRRNDLATMAAHVDKASQQPRFDEYGSPKLAAYWKELEPLAGPGERGTAAMLARSYASAQPITTDAVLAVCAPGRIAADEALRASCGRVGKTMAQRGSSLLARVLGAHLIERSELASAKSAATRGMDASLRQLQVRCGDLDAQLARGLESVDPKVRGQTTELAVALVVDAIATDEATACERQAVRLERTK